MIGFKKLLALFLISKMGLLHFEFETVTVVDIFNDSKSFLIKKLIVVRPFIDVTILKFNVLFVLL
jgi:hypothetical protein